MGGERFGHSNGDSGWRWDKGGMGGKEACPATEIKEGLGKGKEYEVNTEEHLSKLTSKYKYSASHRKTRSFMD